MTANCPKCGLLKAQGVDAMGLAMAQCVCHFQLATHPSYGEILTHAKILEIEFNKGYDSGWNSALEMAACRIENDFKKAFGKDTLISFSVYLRGMKK
jgi:hypothetical protein